MKNKKIIILLVIAVVVLFIIVYDLYIGWGKRQGINLVLNPSFETLKENKPESWIESSQEGWSVTEKGAYEGKRCIQAIKGWSDGWSWLEQEIPIKPRKYYTLKAYVKSDITIAEGEDQGDTFITLECLSWLGKIIKRDWGIVDASSSWQQYMRQIYVPWNTRKIRIKLAKRQGEGSVWFDGLTLVETPSNLVLNNPSFEILSQGKPQFWIESSQGGWSVIEEGAYEGRKCMKATKGWSDGWSWLEQEIPVQPRKYYTLKAYVKSDITIPEGEDEWDTFLTLECLNNKNEVIEREWGLTDASSSWQLKEASVYAPGNSEKIRIKLAKRQGEGSVWFDGLKLTAKPGYLKIAFLRRVLKDKPFWIFYSLIYLLLIFLLLRAILRS